ncbi:DNA-binding transcriptional LysR family regulator [Xanthomonas arboricola]|nr:DNA-binding transcriptional LysR family regulator [Xanthomonas euroxanthea]
MSQPAVTLQLQALERDLGVALFERSGRRMAPSREGQLLYDMALPLVESLDGLEASFREKVRGLDAGELNIAANSSTILYLLPRIVAKFRARHPDVRLTLHNAISADGTDLLREDAVDLAIGSMLDVPADLNYAPVYRFEQLLIAPHDHPLAGTSTVTLQDLSPYPLILPPRRQVTYRLVDLVFQQARVPYTVALEVGGWEVIKQYVAMGMGISIVTAICVTEADRDTLATRSLKDYFPTRSYGVVVRKGKYLSPQARAFIELIQPDLFPPRGYDESGDSER